ncbi:hypothetical protein SLE2022_058920 [Rubroshorea leprosula]
MVAYGQVPDLTSYSILLDVLCKNGLIREALGLFQVMQKNGFHFNIVHCNFLIDGMSEAGLLNIVGEFFGGLSLKGPLPIAHTYTVMIKGFCKAALPDEALELFQAMQNKKFQLIIFNYNVLVDGLCKARQINIAKEFFGGLSLIHLSLHTYTIIINGLCKAGLPNEAFELFKKWKRMGTCLIVVLIIQ